MQYDITTVSGPDIRGNVGYGEFVHGHHVHGAEVGVSKALAPHMAGHMAPHMVPGHPYHPSYPRQSPIAYGPGGTGLYKDPGAQHLRRQLAPLPVTVLPPASIQTATLPVQRVFRVERLVLNSTLNQLSQTQLTQFNVGQTPQFANTGSVPVQTFFATAFDVGLRGNTAYPGLTITLIFLNLGLAQDTISGTIIGECVEE